MENASKALIMAGGILIAIITISVFTYMSGQISFFMSETDNDSLTDEIVSYNAAFEAYNKKLMYGVDVISVYNKAKDNNATYGSVSGEEYYVEIYVSLTKGSSEYVTFDEFLASRGYTSSTELSNEKTSDATKRLYGPGADGVTNGETWCFKAATFQCTGIKYNSSGRVCEMKFQIYYEE